MLGVNAIMYLVARANYLLFHGIAEGFAIVVAALLYVLAVRSHRYSRNDEFLVLGIAYAHVAVLDFFHMLSYKGMGVFPGFDSDVPTQLWIVGRAMEAVSLLLVIFRCPKVNSSTLTLVYSFLTATLLCSIMVFPVFPPCFVEGQGLTPFKIGVEYVIIGVLLAGAYTLRVGRSGQSVSKTVGYAMIVTAAAELAFTLYTDVYGFFNMLGHMIKIVSYYIIFAGVAAQGIDEPYSLMAEELKDRALKDSLTGLYNRQGMIKLAQRQVELAARGENSLGVLLIDLDDFKGINDTYGHLVGDEVLVQFASLLAGSIRKGDVACRFGGDEFVIMIPDASHEELLAVKSRIYEQASAWLEGDERLKGLDLSIGISFLNKGQSHSIDGLINTADASMYEVKQSKAG